MASYGVLGELAVPLVLGVLRLSTEGRPATADAIAVIHRALDAGLRVFDTADSYALSDQDLHYGEHLVASALAQWSGPRETVRIITKAGMARPKGRWVPNARPEHLRRAVEGSLRALGVERLPLFLLHGNDPGTPFEDSLGTLAALQREGKIEHLGLCNVELAEILQAERHFTVAAIQNELSVINRKAATEGTLALAQARGIPFLAHRPLGGHAKTDSLLKNRAVKPIAERHGISPHEAALASLLDLGRPVLPVLGATRPERIDSWQRALAVHFGEQDRTVLASKISFLPDAEGAAQLAPLPSAEGLRAIHPGEAPGSEPEVVLVMGVQGAGKSTLVQRYVDAGYRRLNRDLIGGSLADLLPMLEAALAGGEQRVVLDNTYPTRVSRWPLIRIALRHRVPVRCVHLATPVREALINISLRLLERYGFLPGPDELKELAKQDPNLPPPAALARYAASFEAPQADEGFGAIEEVPFVRQPTGPLGGSVKALLLDVDGTLRRTRSGEIYPRDPEDIEILPGRREKLAQDIAEGWTLFLVSNQSGVASGQVSQALVEACFARTIELLSLPVADVIYCPHTAFPAGCFCRKPMPGMGVALARKHGLAIDQWRMVGDMASDADFARAIGARYHDASEYFGS